MVGISNIRIGTKLGIANGIGVLLVGTLVTTLVIGGGMIRHAIDEASHEQHISHDVMAAKAAERGMQTSVRDVSLARNAEDLRTALQSLDARHKAAHELIDPLIATLRVPENRARMERLKVLLDNYLASAKELAAMKSDVLALEARRADTSDAANRIAALDDQISRFARERTLPIAVEMEGLIDRAEETATSLAKSEFAESRQTMASTERLMLILGILTVMLLIGASVFGAMSIARPLRKMGAVLQDLTNDRLVDVPYTARKDEIGEIARATELFKESIAEKITNLRVRSALDVVRSNVMVADDGYNIMYMNNTLRVMLQQAEPELRKALPQFDANKLMGVNMDIFHRNPAHQRRVLDQLTGTHEAHIVVGALKFHLVATAVLDKNGKRTGTVVEWRNETQEKAIEEEVDGLVKAAVAGDFSRRVPLDGKTGFMLNLATSMNSLCENVAGVMDDMVEMFGGLADGDFTRRITANYQGAFGKLKNDANAMADRISSTVSEIKSAAREVTNAAAEISTSTTDLSQRTEEQAASLEETSASMEEIAATVKKNAENAQQANQSAQSTRDVAGRGGEVVAKAVEAMSRIEESSRKIADIIGVIDEIARQTNLLALNAAVEAARAGEAGRGFAVVASEVRSLAQRSSQAAKDIKDLITNSNSQVQDGVDLVNRAGTALSEIVDSIKRVAEIVSDIAAASAEQSSGIEQVNKALTQMDEVTQQNSALVEQNAATAKTLEHQSKAMNQRVGFFRIDAQSDTAAPQDNVVVAVPVREPATTKPPAARSKRPAAAAGLNGRGSVGRMQAALATALQDDPEWKEF